MMWLQLTIVAAVLGLGSPAYLDGTYMILMPKTLRPGQNFDVSAVYNYTSASAAAGQVSVVMEMAELRSEIPLHSQTYVMDPAPCAPGFTGGCPVSQVLSFQVPASVRDLTGSEFNISISGDINGQFKFQNSSTVKLMKKTVSVMVQTDKAMYKPSQTVKFRVIAVTSNLKPVVNKFNISIHDPADNKIKQWLNVMSEEGLISRELPLSDQPPLGEWTINVKGQDTGEVKSFVIDEYVLPKVQLTVNAPSFLLTSADKMAVTVEAKYTYGQPMKGNCTIKTMFEKYRYDRYNIYPEIKEPKDLKMGKVSLTFDRATISRIVPRPNRTGPADTVDDLMSRVNYRNILVSAKCQDAVTDKIYEENATIPVRSRKYQLEFLELTADTFKPGMNFTAYIKVSLPDGTPPLPSDLKHPNGSEIQLGIRDTEYRTYYQDYYRGQGPPADPPANWTTTFDSSGLAVLTFPVPLNRANQLQIEARFGYGTDSYYMTHYASMFKSRDKQSIQVGLVGSTGEIKVGEQVQFRIATSQASKQAYLQLLSKGKLVKVEVVTSATATLTHTLAVTLTSDLAQRLAPSARAVVWYVTTGGELVADSLDFSVQGAFANDVSVSFGGAETVRPGQAVQVEVSAAPQSLVALLAVDQSSLLLASGNDLTRDQVIEEIKTYDSVNTDDYGFGPRPMWRRKRSVWCPWCYTNTGGKDTTEIFGNGGMIQMTDIYIYLEPPPRPWWMRTTPRRPVIGTNTPLFTQWATTSRRWATTSPWWASNRPTMMASTTPLPMMTTTFLMMPQATVAAAARPDSGEQAPVPVRDHFPESWLWAEKSVGEDGKVSIQTVVPDTITSWVTSALAMHKTAGLGITAETSKLTVFKPFFVSLDLPYSVLRGETVELKVVVYNYLADALDVLVTVNKSDSFKVQGANEVEPIHASVEATLTVPGGDGKSLSLWITPTQLGAVDIGATARSNQAADAVRRQLLVEAEGATQTYNVNLMTDNSGDSEFEETIKMAVPSESEGLVEGSVKVMATAVGDIMGPALSNLDRLIRMPSGCGEQNMIGFVPNIYVMDYLRASGRDDDAEIRDKATRNMEKGYQKEMTYQHKDGSFSAFGERDPSGSTWLTAFVLKSFCEAEEYIDVDVDNINKIVRFLVNTQDRNKGHFPEVGKVIHKDMQGGSSAGVSLTAYTVATLLESCYDKSNKDLKDRVDNSIELGLKYLLQEYDSDTISENGYVMAILAYALQVAKADRAEEILTKLQTLAKQENGLMYWQEKSQVLPGQNKDLGGGRQLFIPPRYQASASAIEQTSYGLLAMVQAGKIPMAVPIMKYLVQQRNSQGGFASTQDTVMALNALSRFAAGVGGSGDQNIKVDITVAGYDYSFPERITDSNKLLLQRLDISEHAPNEYVTVRARGTGSALIQLSVEYNVHEEYAEPGMNLEVTSKQLRDGVVEVEVCAWYTPEDPSQESGMVVAEVTPLSGYTATNLDELRGSVDGLQRVEQIGNKFVFYYNELVAAKKCIFVMTERVNKVVHYKKALVSAYRYYEPAVKQSNFYLPRELLLEKIGCLKDCDEGVSFVFRDVTRITDKDKSAVDQTINHPWRPNRYPNAREVTDGASVVSMTIVVIATILGVHFL